MTEIKKRSIKNLSISLFTFLLILYFVFFAIKGLVSSLYLLYVNHELMMIHLVKHNLTIEDLADSISIAGLINSELIAYRYDEVKIIVNFAAIIFTFCIIFSRSWTNIKKNIEKKPPETIKLFLPNIQLHRKIKWYIGNETSSYGFFSKKIILGIKFFYESENEKKFYLYHELNHLRYRDSIIKNFILNTINIFLPLFCILQFIFSVGAILIFHHTYFFEIILSFSFPLIILIILVLSMKKFLFWFSRTKEILSDEYAMNMTNGYISSFSQVNDKYHPSSKERILFLKSNKKIDVSPFLALSLVFLNLKTCFPLINDYNFDYLILVTVFTFILIDLLFLKSFKIERMWRLLGGGVIFFVLNLIILKLGFLPNYKDLSLSIILYNFVFVFIALIYFLINKRR
jgi:hypothetical protein